MFLKKTRRYVGIFATTICGSVAVAAHAQAIEASSFMAPEQLTTTNTIIPVKWEAVPVTKPNTSTPKQGTNTVGTKNNSVVIEAPKTQMPASAASSMANSAKASAMSGGSVVGVSVLFFQAPPPPVSCSKPGNGYGHGHGCDDGHGNGHGRPPRDRR